MWALGFIVYTIQLFLDRLPMIFTFENLSNFVVDPTIHASKSFTLIYPIMHVWIKFNIDWIIPACLQSDPKMNGLFEILVVHD